MNWRGCSLIPLALVAALAFGGCGSGGDSSSEGGSTGSAGKPTAPSAGNRPSGPAAVNTNGVPGLGMTLIKSNKEGELTLYEFSKDRANISTCYGACAKTWPPLLTEGKPEVGFGAYEAELGRTKRKDGTTQVTYAGHPVYGFSGDKRYGEASGNGVSAFGGKWHALQDPRYG